MGGGGQANADVICERSLTGGNIDLSWIRVNVTVRNRVLVRFRVSSVGQNNKKKKVT